MLFILFLRSFLASSLFFLPLAIFLSFFLFLLLFSSYHTVFSLFRFFILDSYSLLLIFLSVLVVYSSYLFALRYNSNLISCILYFMFFPCFFVFSSSNVLLLYSFYELSLVPIVFIIVK